jgi:tetratricopeptide (TPR) repeat protein
MNLPASYFATGGCGITGCPQTLKGGDLMELLYNPDSMNEDEIKKTFVGRQGLIDELVALIGSQPDGAGVQHVVIIAPRGMGKTTVLLMLQFAVRETDLAERWKAVRFSEESYGIYDLSDFWIEALSRLAAETDDAGLLARADGLRGKYRDNEDLQEAALALIKDWRREHGKRLLLLVDNFDMILEQINDERDNARLRDVLMNDGTMMLIGGAPTFFQEARAYDQPLYNFFKIHNLENLRFEQMQELLRRRAEIDKLENFEETLKTNEGRLRVLEYFTGGNPRLVLMLYRVVTQSDISEVKRGLEKLLDQVTPYYKSKVESLPPQQRKILDHIARVSSQTREGVRPTEIAEATRLKPNQVSAQLKRLSELGYVHAANLRERNSYYVLSEPLYAIWHQMRFGRDARQRMRWLVDFLKVWYKADELGTESQRLAGSFRDHLSAGRLHEARDVLDHQRFLAEAMDDSPTKAQTVDAVIRSYLELKEFDVLKREVLTPDMLRSLSEQTLTLLHKVGCVSAEDVTRTKNSKLSSEELQQKAELVAAMRAGLAAFEEGKTEEAIKKFDQLIELMPDSAPIWGVRGAAFFQAAKYEDALTSVSHALELRPDVPVYWSLQGKALDELGRPEEALASFDYLLKLRPNDADAWHNRAHALLSLERYDDAIDSSGNAFAIAPNEKQIQFGHGITLLIKFLMDVAKVNLVSARNNWTKAIKLLELSEDEKRYEVINETLIGLSDMGELDLARQLIRESQLEEVVFPLTRALDYLITGDKSLIEKLSPEIRNIVEEIVKKLRPVAKASTKSGSKKQTRKSKPSPRRRTTKRLR